MIMNKKEFELKKEIIELEMKRDKLKHIYHIIELELQRSIEREKAESQKEVNRIKSAEIRKVQERRENMRFMNSYKNDP